MLKIFILMIVTSVIALGRSSPTSNPNEDSVVIPGLNDLIKDFLNDLQHKWDKIQPPEEDEPAFTEQAKLTESHEKIGEKQPKEYHKEKTKGKHIAKRSIYDDIKEVIKHIFNPFGDNDMVIINDKVVDPTDIKNEEVLEKEAEEETLKAEHGKQELDQEEEEREIQEHKAQEQERKKEDLEDKEEENEEGNEERKESKQEEKETEQEKKETEQEKEIEQEQKEVGGKRTFPKKVRKGRPDQDINP